MANEEAGQLKIHQQINAAIQQRQVLMEANAAQIKGQTQLAMEMCKALACEDLEGMSDRISEITDAMQEAADKANDLSGKMDKISKITDKTSKGFKGLNTSMASAGAAGVNMGAALANGLAAGKEAALGMINTLGSVASSVFSLSKAVLMAPFTMLQGLVGMAQSGGGGGGGLREAIEGIRKEFGDLASNEGAALMGSLKTLKGQMRNLGGSGLKLKKLFGNLGEALKQVTALAVAAGPAFGLLKDQFEQNAGEILAFQKGLGLADDEMGAFMKRAAAMGTSVTDELTEVASLSLQMGEKFGVSAKLISKDIGKMMKDFSNFGSLSKKELASTAVYARKLGMEIDDMMGVIDKFDNFEDAAQGASMLAQSFGMNVDAMEMMNAESPAERIDMLRKSFAATGKDIADMTRQERKLLEQQTGLTGAALEAAFANENMGLSYDDIQAGADEAEEKQLSTEEAMSKLADSMERLVKSGGGGGGFTGFFDAFFKGFKKGFTSMKPFRQLLKNINKSLKVVYRAGIKLGKMFFKMFPGIEKMTKALRDMFDPKKMKKMMNGVLKDFKKFFQMLKTDPKAGAEFLIKALKKEI